MASLSMPSFAKQLVAEGDIVDDRYAVSHFIAEGGVADVFEARDLSTSEAVALKIARLDVFEDVDRRFLREARVYDKVRSIHLPTLKGTGFLAEGAPYMALELLCGCTLGQSLSSHSMSVAGAIECTKQLLAALHAIHCEQIIHCDVKPANVFLHEEPSGNIRVKLIDFGICRSAGWQEEAHRRGVPGSPPFMSLEQLQGRRLDARSDLYSAGVTMYAMLTGRLPFRERTPERTVAAVLNAPVVPPRVLRPSCPVELERFVMKALARRVEYRFASAVAMLDELTWIASRYSYKSGRAAFAESGSIAPPSPSAMAMTTKRESSNYRLRFDSIRG